MSKPTRVSFRGSNTGRPGSSGLRKPSSTAVCPGATAGSKVCTATKKRLTIPALSIPPKKPPFDPILERLKKKTIRRNAPQGEDIKKIREIIKSIKKEVITVQEFVGLIAPYTGDNGNVLRTVMGDDLSSFRRMAKRVYDTMTQDVSDVLANEQIHLTEYYNERYTLFMDKMMRTIDEIYTYVPDFNFELYYTDLQYVDRLFPIADDRDLADPEEREMQRRQEAYHRLQWLRSEGIRLNEENVKLQRRLKELKALQREELMIASQQEQVAETQKNQLEAAQANLQNQLQKLNDSLEKSLIHTEEEMRLTEDAKITETAAKKQAKRLRSQQQMQSKPSRNVGRTETAEHIGVVSGPSRVTVSARTGAVKKSIKSKSKKLPKRIKIKDPYDFSPVRSPPKQKERELSPFHYSPPKTPPGQQTSPFHYSPARSTARGGPATSMETVRTETTTTVIDRGGRQAPEDIATCPATRQMPCPRRGLAPRDTWGGFG